MIGKQEIVSLLEQKGVPFQLVEHPPVDTIEELNRQQIPRGECVAKNLFLRDASGKHHFLVMIKGEKTADLKKLRRQIGSTPLSFASEERLMNHLGLKKGSVTPLGLFNDEERTVEVIIDKDILNQPCVGVHPNVNTAMVFLSQHDLEKLIQEHGNIIRYIAFES